MYYVQNKYKKCITSVYRTLVWHSFLLLCSQLILTNAVSRFYKTKQCSKQYGENFENVMHRLHRVIFSAPNSKLYT